MPYMSAIHKHTTKCGELPSKLAMTKPWKKLCLELIGPYLAKTIMDIMCITMNDQSQKLMVLDGEKLPLTDPVKTNKAVSNQIE